MHIYLQISSYSHVSFITIELKLNEILNEIRPNMTIKSCFSLKRDILSTRFVTKSSSFILAKMITFENGAVAFAYTSNIIEIYKNSATS